MFKLKLPKIHMPRSITNFGVAVASKFRHKSPEICLVVGMVSGGAALVAVGYKTWKHKDRLEKDIGAIKKYRHYDPNTAEEGEALLSEEERVQELYSSCKRMGIDTIRVYWLPTGFAVLSMICFMKGHSILRRELSGALASYAILLDRYNRLNERIVDKYGIEASQELLHGIEVTDIVDAETGKVYKKAINKGASCSMYARMYDEGDFDSETGHWRWRNTSWRDNKNDNIYNLKLAQSMANDAFNARGWYKLNEAYAICGLPPTKEGEHVGWVLGSGHDDYIDFGVFDNPRHKSRQLPVNQLFLDLHNPQNFALLDFNVDGCIDYIFDDILEYDIRSYISGHKRGVKP